MSNILCILLFLFVMYLINNNSQQTGGVDNKSYVELFSLGDDKIKKIFSNKNINSKKDLIKLSHTWCANMRSSKSLSTSCIALKDSNKKNEKIFPVSVCCSSCYCNILKKDSDFYYKYDKNNDIFCLMKNNKIVQFLEGYDINNLDNCVINTENSDLYFPFISKDIIKNKICK